ncbi:hypothetical protein [Streptomyces longispororuber]|uniref:hypothetical protein n=1 Tax=Streptomyces longispororuber TaxID=68230 RepID=UPI0036FA47DE
MEAGLLTATWPADLDDADDVVAVAAHVRASVKAHIERAQREFTDLVGPGALDADPALAASRSPSPRSRLCRSTAAAPLQAEANARRAYKTEQGRRWCKHTRTVRTPSPRARWTATQPGR